MAYDYTNIDVDPPLLEQQYSATVTQTFAQPVIPEGTTVVTTINAGGGGHANGPNVTFSGGATGYDFSGAGSTITLAVSNATTVRTSISAAKSGVNADITQFTGLVGNTGFNAWTGTPDQASHATFSGTASVGYVQAELQAVMDSLEQATGLIMALLTALLANGVIET